MATELPSGSASYQERLRRLGLEAEYVFEALGASNSERGLCDPDHCSKSAQGYYAYNGMLSSMSRQLCGEGWERNDPMSMPLLINHDRKVVVGVTSGDQYTGLLIAGEQPATRNPKGELTKTLIKQNRNQGQEVLLDIAEKSAKRELLEKISDYSFWLTLVFFDKEKSEIRSEVSQPIDSNHKGHPCVWGPRIILPPYQIDDMDFGGNDDPNDGFDPIDVPLSRR